ncbi:MAG: hypothetical protein HY290_21115 [Planctomycetia bacterium]|nr:hypothetical protein [Planctomycetia bacterium]
MSHDDRPSAVRGLALALRFRLPLEVETGLFILASALDVFMTRYLITSSTSTSHISFVEGNPIARYFLDSWGPDGLTWFKFGLVAVVSIICQVIARRKIDVARRVLLFATVAVMGVVIYSVVLMVQHI